jgi:hypothetical protein
MDANFANDAKRAANRRVELRNLVASILVFDFLKEVGFIVVHSRAFA